MLELCRLLRFSVSFDRAEATSTSQPRHNSFAGWPSFATLAAYYELQVCCAGNPDPKTGYLINISRIDDIVREHGIPLIRAACHEQPSAGPGPVLPRLLATLQSKFEAPITSIRWQLTPYHWVAMSAQAPDRIALAQQFMFSAAHRLNVSEFDQARNREIFGKCNNHNGHGHNYRVEVVVSIPANQDSSAESFSLADLERIVDLHVIQRFDHKHLNLDTSEFASVNPSVENITLACHRLLQAPLANAGAELEHVTVWETDKTSCTYPTPNHDTKAASRH
jgi:6-pyruvoyltetrahydropterin/6-carboxytetrahydropterin synthase